MNISPVPSSLPSILTQVCERVHADPELQPIVIVGLGSLGIRHTERRHNIGYKLVEQLRLDWEAVGTNSKKRIFSEMEHRRVITEVGKQSENTLHFSSQRGTYRSDDGECFISNKFPGRLVMLVRAHKYINYTGEFMGPFLKYMNQNLPHSQKVNGNHLIVIRDDMKTEPGFFCVTSSEVEPGRDNQELHNGILSINEALGPLAQPYYQLRIGIGVRRSCGGGYNSHVEGIMPPEEQHAFLHAPGYPQIKSVLETIITTFTDQPTVLNAIGARSINLRSQRPASFPSLQPF